MRAMKKKCSVNRVFREMKQRRVYEKPSEKKKARLQNESTRRFKKLLLKKIEFDGF